MMTDLFTHICPFSTLDYSRVEQGQIVCVECGRRWELRTWNGGGQWICNYPPIRIEPQNLWPLEPPEVLAQRRQELNERQARLNQLVLVERQRAQELSETMAAQQRLSSKARRFTYSGVRRTASALREKGPGRARAGDRDHASSAGEPTEDRPDAVGAIQVRAVFTKASVFNSLKAQVARLDKDSHRA
jgi:hypothetical protein